MVNNTSQAGIGDWLKQLLSYLKGARDTTKTTPDKPTEDAPWAQRSVKKYIQNKKPKDEDEKRWLIQEYRRLEEDKSVPDVFKLRFYQYMVTEYPDYVFNAAKGSKKKKEPY